MNPSTDLCNKAVAGLDPGMARQVALVRTHQMGPAEDRLIKTLRAGFGDDIVLCFDAQNGPPPRGFPKTVAMTPALLKEMGLIFPEDWAWRCGDFCHYAAARAYPDYDHYWLFEPDVAFNQVTVSEFLAATDASDADFLAAFVATAIAATAGLRFEAFRALAPGFFTNNPPLFSWRRSVMDVDMPHLPPGILHPVMDKATFEARILGPRSRSWIRQDADYLTGVLNRHYAPADAQRIFNAIRWQK